MTLPKTNEPNLDFTEVHTTLSWKSFGFFKRNMRTAGDLYTNLQRQALGIKPVVKDRGKGMEMEH